MTTKTYISPVRSTYNGAPSPLRVREPFAPATDSALDAAIADAAMGADALLSEYCESINACPCDIERALMYRAAFAELGERRSMRALIETLAVELSA